MKKILVITSIILSSFFSLTGCCEAEGKNASIPIIYGVIALLSAIILLGYLVRAKKKEFWITILFASIFIVNVSYFCISISHSLQWALMANRLAYLGSVFLPMTMLFIILKATKTAYTKRLPIILSILSTVVFLIAASQGILKIYYKAVSLDTSLGFSFLVKDYAPLHSLYTVYLVGYFAVMVAFIIIAIYKKKIDSPAHSIILTCAVLVNIGVWTLGQTWGIEFEFLSVSYLITELFLLGLHTIITENDKLKALIKEKNDTNSPDSEAVAPSASSEKIAGFINGITQLTNTEKIIFDAYVAKSTTKEIMATLNIKENTLKFHNKNIYGKLGVSSRKELQEINALIQAQKNDPNT